jgi:hypothetical protein
MATAAATATEAATMPTEAMVARLGGILVVRVEWGRMGCGRVKGQDRMVLECLFCAVDSSIWLDGD